MTEWYIYDTNSFSADSENESEYLNKYIPLWVSLESIEFQNIWQNTAGKRPIQPKNIRKYYEDI